jgi:hypothetical protein
MWDKPVNRFNPSIDMWDKPVIRFNPSIDMWDKPVNKFNLPIEGLNLFTGLSHMSIEG